MYRTATISALALFALGCGGESTPETSTTAGTPVITVASNGSVTTESAPAKTVVIPENVSFEDADSAYASGEYGEATLKFSGYVTAHPENPWGFYMLGLSAWKSGENERAIGAFEQALELDPMHVKSHFNLARVLIEVGHPVEAREQIVLAMEIDSMSAEAYRLLGRADYETGDTRAAISDYQEALTLDDQDVWSMNNLGLIYLRQDEPAEALPPLALAVELRGNAPVFRNNLGMALELLGQHAAAEVQYSKAVEADSTYVKAVVNLQRVQGFVQDSTVTPVDLGEVAAGFGEEIQGWKGE